MQMLIHSCLLCDDGTLRIFHQHTHRALTPPQQNSSARSSTQPRARVGCCRRARQRHRPRHHKDAVQRASLEERGRHRGRAAAHSFGKARRVARNRQCCGFSCQQRCQLCHRGDDYRERRHASVQAVTKSCCVRRFHVNAGVVGRFVRCLRSCLECAHPAGQVGTAERTSWEARVK
jgi:hypothetical protein